MAHGPGPGDFALASGALHHVPDPMDLLLPTVALVSGSNDLLVDPLIKGDSFMRMTLISNYKEIRSPPTFLRHHRDLRGNPEEEARWAPPFEGGHGGWRENSTHVERNTVMYQANM